MRINLNGVKPMEGFEPVPIGWYHCRVIQTDEMAKPGKAPYVAVRFEIISGEFAKRKLFRNFIITDAAMGFLKPFLVCCGINPDFDGEVDWNDFLDMQMMVFVNHEKYEGKIKEKVDSFKTLDIAGIEPKIVKDDKAPF